MKKIAVIPNRNKDKEYKFTKMLCRYLSGKADIFMPYEDTSSEIDATYCNYDKLYNEADAVIILGGDGTILQAAEPCGRNSIPVMGINLGKVGFMTEVKTDDTEKAVSRLLSDDYNVEKRMMMEITVIKQNGETESFTALNDAVISKPKAEMVTMELSANGEKVSEYIADGLIISTPTGSTGYSLSAGGPVCDPAMSLFIATPICAHKLSARPMLLSDKKKIEIKLTDIGSDTAVLTVDGNDKCEITKKDRIVLNRSAMEFHLIKLGKQSFYHTMMTKL